MLMSILKEVRNSEEIGQKEFSSRFEYEVYNSQNFVGVAQSEKKPELKQRDMHLLYAKRLGYVTFEAKKMDSKDEFFGGWVSITPVGLAFLEDAEQGWLGKQLEALKNGVLTILVAVIITWAIYYLGAPTK
jgi:hypothetical protein